MNVFNHPLDVKNRGNMQNTHKILLIFDSQYKFANISATKARVLIKCLIQAHMIGVNSYKISGEDWCTNEA